jgi:LuxR family transcriptional regulator
VSEVCAILCRIADSTTADAAFEAALGFLRSQGFSRVNYGLTRFSTGSRSVGDPDDALFLSSNPPDYAKLYFADGFYLRTPLFRWAMLNVGCCTWRWVQEALEAGRLSKDEADAVQTNTRMGIIAGLTVSFPITSTRSKAAIGLAADVGLTHDDVDQVFATRGSEILAVAHMMHLKVSQLPLVTRRRPLTDRQREVLEWVADGKTTQDIAQIMGVSTAMVEKHLRLAREALDVETTAQAVAKGTLLNTIFQRPAPPLAAGLTRGS